MGVTDEPMDSSFLPYHTTISCYMEHYSYLSPMERAMSAFQQFGIELHKYLCVCVCVSIKFSFF